jgi:hypothetical protein
MSEHKGGCLCGAIRYNVSAEPVRVTFCHCAFCQRSTGSAYAVEPVFSRFDFEIIKGTTAVYTHRSVESGKTLAVNFCRNCGTKIFLDFERFPDVRGVYGGTFDDPNWFDRSSQIARHIFLESAQRGTIIPAMMPTYQKHATQNDGTPADPETFEVPFTVD